MVTVWIDAWQWQCCGEAFAVGDRVGWTLAAGCDLEHLRPILGCRLAEEIGFSEDHHGGLPDDTPVTHGRVRAITAVHCRFGVRDDPRLLYPVAGSGRPVAVTTADGWEAEQPGVDVQGYVVALEV